MRNAPRAAAPVAVLFVLGGLVCGTVSAATPIPRALEGKELTRLPTRERVVALTFDGGGNADGTRQVLETLRRRLVPATFFLTGRFVRTYPALARRIARDYPVGNHTHDHPYLTRLASPSVRGEILAAERAIRRVAH